MVYMMTKDTLPIIRLLQDTTIEALPLSMSSPPKQIMTYN